MSEADDEEARDELWNLRRALILRAVANRIYQQKRQSLFETRENIVKALSLTLGAAAVVKVADPQWVTVCGAVIGGASMFSLVFGWGTRARDAAKRTVEWTQFESDIEAAGRFDFTDDQVAAWTARAAKIEIGEASQHRGLWARSYTKACEVLKQTPLKPFGWWDRNRPVFFVA